MIRWSVVSFEEAEVNHGEVSCLAKWASIFAVIYTNTVVQGQARPSFVGANIHRKRFRHLSSVRSRISLHSSSTSTVKD